MSSKIASFLFHSLMGWKLLGSFPKRNKYVVIVVPHTHWMDFIIGILVRAIVNEKINYVAKKALFKAPYGWFFKATGGAPVDRQKNSNMVDSTAKIFKEREEFRLALAPEGTRKKVQQLKTGFYYIAQKAKVPIIMVAFNFGKKEVTIAEPFWPSGHLESDMQKVYTYYRDVKGKIPEYSFDG